VVGGEIHMTHPQSRVKVEKVGLLLLQIVIVVAIDLPGLSMEGVEWHVVRPSREARHPFPRAFLSFLSTSPLSFYLSLLSFVPALYLSFIHPSHIHWFFLSCIIEP
jgi:hypothetical protein